MGPVNVFEAMHLLARETTLETNEEKENLAHKLDELYSRIEKMPKQTLAKEAQDFLAKHKASDLQRSYERLIALHPPKTSKKMDGVFHEIFTK